jgi:hypothetical protein
LDRAHPCARSNDDDAQQGPFHAPLTAWAHILSVVPARRFADSALSCSAAVIPVYGKA